MKHPLERLGSLSDPSAHTAPLEVPGSVVQEALGLLRTMKLARTVEEAIAEMVRTGEARCPCHLAIGQEAAAVGVGVCLDTARDRSFGAHRAHAQFLALGGTPQALLAEVLGKDTGCSRGMGGSMHLVEPSVGLMGTVPIVGASIPLAVGAGLALKMEGNGGVGVAFFGDGATEEGVFHEGLNFASTMGLPVLFVCENNFFSSHLHIDLRQPTDRLTRFAEAHSVASWVVDGNDVLAVREATRRALDHARGESRPVFLELVTYRWRGHVGHREDMDVGVKRDEELPRWKARDPILRLAEGLRMGGHAQERDLTELDEEVCREVETALVAARAAPYPDPDAMARYLYSPERRA